MLLVFTYEYQKYFVRHFFVFVRSLPIFDINHKMEWRKKRGVNETFIFARKKLLSLKFEFWPIFSLKLDQNSNFKLNNFLCSNDKLFADHAFFPHSKLYFMLNFVEDRMSRKKLRNKILLVFTYEYQKYFVWHFFPVFPITTKLWHELQLGMAKKHGASEPFIFARKNVIEFEMWILTDF